MAVLASQWGDYGLPPKRSSFIMHAMLVAHYLDGASYPLGGSSRLAEAFCAAIEADGGQLSTRTPAKQIHIENNTVKGVYLEDGRYVQSPVVVSTIGMRPSLERLIPRSHVKLAGLREDVAKLKASTAHVCLYLGLKGSHCFELTEIQPVDTPKLDFDASYESFLSSNSYEFPFFFVSFPAAKDPSWIEHHKDYSTIEVIAPARLEWFEPWLDTSWKRRGPRYENLKEVISEHLLGVVLARMPQLESAIDYSELSTP